MTIASEQEIVRISQQQPTRCSPTRARARAPDARRRRGLRRRGVRPRGAEPRHAAWQRAPLPRPSQRKLDGRGPLDDRHAHIHPFRALRTGGDASFRRRPSRCLSSRRAATVTGSKSPLSWQVDVTNTATPCSCPARLPARPRPECARCLDGFALPLAGEVEGYFLLDARDESPEDMDDDEFDVLPEDHVIDLEPLLKAALLLELPLVPLCDEECRGLCPSCGANLNEGPCGCAREGRRAGGDDAPPQPVLGAQGLPL